MADDDPARRAREHLEQVVDRILDAERVAERPQLTRLRAVDLPEVSVDGMAVEDVEVECDLCSTVAVGPLEDGWKTPEQRGPVVAPDAPPHEHVGYYVLCTPCKEAWQRADYDELYKRCDDRVRNRVDDLAHLAGDTLLVRDVAQDRQQPQPGDDYLGPEL